jgi:hypothetical protein
MTTTRSMLLAGGFGLVGCAIVACGGAIAGTDSGSDAGNDSDAGTGIGSPGSGITDASISVVVVADSSTSCGVDLNALVATDCSACLGTNCTKQLAVCEADCACGTSLAQFAQCYATSGEQACALNLPSSNALPLLECLATSCRNDCAVPGPKPGADAGP